MIGGNQNVNRANTANLLTASLVNRVSNLKSLSQAFKELEKGADTAKAPHDKSRQESLGELKLEVNGTATFGM